MDAMKPTVPEDGRARFRGDGPQRKAKAFKTTGPGFGHIVQQQENTEQQQHQYGRREHRDEDCVAVDPNGDGGSRATIPGGRDAVIGHELVRQYYTVLYNAPEHVWRFYAEGAQYCDVGADGRRTVVTGRQQLRQLFGTSATVDGDHVNDGRGNSGQVIIESVNTIRCASGQLLVMATSERFVQSFVIEFSAPRSFAVVASIVQHAFVARPPVPAAAYDHGVAQTGHGVAQTDHGVAQTGYGVAQTGYGVAQTDHGVAQTGYGVAQTGYGVAQTGYGVAQTGHAAGGRQQSSTDFQLFVGRLTSATTAEHLRKTFSEYGEVVHVRIIGGHNRSGRPAKYNYAFVTFSRPEGVEAALAGGPVELCNGNRVNVHPSKGRR